MTLAAGTKLGRYEIQSQIGEGGMGKVPLAEDTNESDRHVAHSSSYRELLYARGRITGDLWPMNLGK
jgi:serine/threonine protein kinase